MATPVHTYIHTVLDRHSTVLDCVFGDLRQLTPTAVNRLTDAAIDVRRFGIVGNGPEMDGSLREVWEAMGSEVWEAMGNKPWIAARGVGGYGE